MRRSSASRESVGSGYGRVMRFTHRADGPKRRGAGDSCRPRPPRGPPGGTDALRPPDGTAARELCKVSPAYARRPAYPPRSPPRPAVPPPQPARGGGRAPPVPPPPGAEPLRAAASPSKTSATGWVRSASPAARSAPAHAHRHEIGRDGLVADELRLDRPLHRLEPRDLLLQLGRTALELGDLAPHPLQRSLELEDLLDAGEVHARLGRELLDPAQPLDVRARIEASALGRALRLDQPARLVHPQRLRMHLRQLGGDGDHEDAALVVDARGHARASYGHQRPPRAASRRIRSRGLPFITLESSCTARRCLSDSLPGTSITKR